MKNFTAFNPIPCDLCGNQLFDLIFCDDILDGPLMKCEKCGLIQVNPRKNTYIVKDYQIEQERILAYKKCRDILETKLFYKEEIQEKKRNREIYAWKNRLNKILKFRSSGRMLDIGCDVQFLCLAKDIGFEVYGIQPLTADCARAKREFGMDIVPKTLKEAVFKSEYFDVVTAFKVIEHLPSP